MFRKNSKISFFYFKIHKIDGFTKNKIKFTQEFPIWPFVIENDYEKSSKPFYPKCQNVYSLLHLHFECLPKTAFSKILIQKNVEYWKKLNWNGDEQLMNIKGQANLPVKLEKQNYNKEFLL